MPPMTNDPSESEERAAYSEYCGDAITHMLIDTETQNIIYRSTIRARKSSNPNHRIVPYGGEVSSSTGYSED